MKASSVTFEEHEIVIIGVKSPIIIRIVLVVLLFAFLLIPIAVIIFRVSSNLGLHFSLVPLTIFLWGIAYFFLKTFLWNSYGKETITLAPHFIEYLLAMETVFSVRQRCRRRRARRRIANLGEKL